MHILIDENTYNTVVFTSSCSGGSLIIFTASTIMYAVAPTKISKENIEQLNSKLNLRSYEVSAYTGNNVVNSFNALFYEVLKPVELFVNKFKEEMVQSHNHHTDPLEYLPITKTDKEALARKITISCKGKRKAVESNEVMSNFQW